MSVFERETVLKPGFPPPLLGAGKPVQYSVQDYGTGAGTPGGCDERSTALRRKVYIYSTTATNSAEADMIGQFIYIETLRVRQ